MLVHASFHYRITCLMAWWKACRTPEVLLVFIQIVALGQRVLYTWSRMVLKIERFVLSLAIRILRRCLLMTLLLCNEPWSRYSCRCNIDLKPPSYESACHEAPVATSVCEPAFAAVETDSLGAASACTGTGFMLHAAGTSFSNVTFNVMPRLSLNRKRRWEQKAAFAKLSKKVWI